MIGKNKKWRWGCTGLLLAILLFWYPAKHVSWSVRLGVSILKLASGTEDQTSSVIETKVSRQNGMNSYEALTYRSLKSTATSAVILAPGLSEQGCYHPRMKALARALADSGLFVLTPDIREFRKFKIAAEPIDELVFWHRQATTLEGGEKIRKIGLAGISYSGTLALIAAARPEIRNHVAFVLGIGPYNNLIRCTREWFAAGDPHEWNGNYPTRFYAKWLIMRAALDLLPSPKDRLFVDQVLNDLLLSREAPKATSDLTPEGFRWYNLAIMRPGQADAELAAEIEQHLTRSIYPQLDPQNALRNLRCPLFLIHGAYDDLIPPRESTELHQQYAHSYLLISPFLTHTHPTEKPLTFRQKLATGLDTVKFCYRLAQTIQ
jgi:pimeloyl-ACP methyl ester carboxylesterase